MDVTPTAAESSINRDDPRRANLAQEGPLVQPDNARTRNTLQQRLSVRHIGWTNVNLPGTLQRTPKE